MNTVEQNYDPAMPVANLRQHPENPRRGNDPAVAESVEVNGFYGAVVVQKSTGFVLAGNTRLRVALESGSATIPAFVIDCDDARAKRIMLADNRTSDLATYDDGSVLMLLEAMQAEDAGLLGTGYTDDDLTSLLHNANAYASPGSGVPATGPAVPRVLPVRAIQSCSAIPVHALCQFLGWESGCISTAISGWMRYVSMFPNNPPRLMFMDNEWHGYDHAVHLAAAVAAKPIMCTVRDLVTKQQADEAGVEFLTVDEVLDQAREIVTAAGVEDIIIIPKYDCLDKLPGTIAGARTVLGYSVPSSYGATPLDPLMFSGRPVHLLGGSWKRQRSLLHLLGDDVVSFDNNNFFRIGQFSQFNLPDGSASSLDDIGMPERFSGQYMVASVLSLGYIMNDLTAWGVARREADHPDVLDRDGQRVLNETEDTE